MKFRIRFAEQIVGIFILIGILVLAGSLILMGANQRWFARNYVFSTRFASAGGLAAGKSITLKGFEIGKVSRVELNEENLVDVDFYIFDTYYPKVRQNSVIQVTGKTLGFGGGEVIFHPGRGSGDPLPELSFIPSTDFAEGKRLVAAGLTDTSESKDAMAGLLDRVQVILDDLHPVLISLDRTLVSLDSVLVTTNRSLEGNTALPVGALLSDLDGVLKNVREITANLQSTSEALSDPERFIYEVMDPKSSIATLLNDNGRLFLEIEKILAGVNDSVQEAKEFATYVNSTQPQLLGILEQGRDTLVQGEAVLEGLRNNPLLRGGISEQKEPQEPFRSARTGEFR